jgi:spore germination protein
MVQPGDNLWIIAQRYGTTVEAILQENRIMNPSQIYPGQILSIPDRFKPLIYVNAFTGRFGEQGAQIVRNIAQHLTYLSPFAYRMKEDGSLESINDSAVIQASLSNNFVPMMVITNFSATELGSNVAHTILTNPELQDRLLTNTIQIMKDRGYRGLNIDFESVLPGDRELYNQFLRRAAARLYTEGFFVSSSLAPKVSAEQKGLLYEAHDYVAHGEILDFVVLMTYEWGYRLGPPQPISPIDQIKAVLNYAITVIPRNKIMMGFQLYARDWILPHVQGQQAETFSMQEAILRAMKYGAVIQYDHKSQSPFFRYMDEQGRTHEVWFEDARSAQAKFDLVRGYNLRGISYWELGYPFPQNWVLLEDNFKVRKLM